MPHVTALFTVCYTCQSVIRVMYVQTQHIHLDTSVIRHTVYVNLSLCANDLSQSTDHISILANVKQHDVGTVQCRVT